MDLRWWRTKVPARPDEARGADLTGFLGPSSAIYPSLGGSDYWTSVDPGEALKGTAAVYACVSLVADVIGSLPLHLYQLEDEDRRKRVRPGDADRNMPGRRYPGSLARVLGELPNPEMSAQDLWTTVVGHQALWGNAYLEVVRDDGGRPAELWPLRPDMVEVKRDQSGQKFYRYTVSQTGGSRKVKDLPWDRVMHLPWFGTDGVTGLSPLASARRTLNADSSAQKFVENWFGNRAMPSAILTLPPGPQDKFKERAGAYREQTSQLYGGSANAGRIAVMEQGADWKSISMPFTDMQFVEQRQMTVAEVCRLYRIPQYLMDPTKTSSWGTGVENQFLGFLTLTLRPILSRIEAGISKDLGLVPGERLLSDEKLYVEFQTAALLRTDIKARYEAYGIAIQNRILNPAGVAALENLPYDPERPTEYENPNTSAPEVPATEPAPEAAPLQAAGATLEVERRDADREAEGRRTDALLAAVANMGEMHSADMKMLSEVKRAEVLGLPDVNVTVPEAIVTLPSDMVIPTPQVVIDTQPFADSLRFLGTKLEALDAHQAERDATLTEALARLEPKPTKRTVVRDENSNIVEIREEAV